MKAPAGSRGRSGAVVRQCGSPSVTWQTTEADVERGAAAILEAAAAVTRLAALRPRAPRLRGGPTAVPARAGRLQSRGRAPVRAASLRAGDSAAGADRGDMCRPRGRRGNPRSPTRRRFRTRPRRGRAAPHRGRAVCAPRGSRSLQASAARPARLAFQQHVTDHPPLACDRLVREEPDSRRESPCRPEITAPEQLVAAADREQGRTGRRRI